MSSYRGTAGNPDRVKAIAAVVAVHVALAFAILSGLDVQRSIGKSEPLVAMINLGEVRPPLPVRRSTTRPKPRVAKPPRRAVAEASPMALDAPAAEVPVRSAIAVAPFPVAGSAPSRGAAVGGNGGAAGGAGAATAGRGDFSRFTPARLVSNIPNSQYARLAATGLQSGTVGIVILVDTAGNVSNCRVARSSGEPRVDALVCQLTERYVRFDPARDPDGRPVPQDITYFPSWRRR